MEKLLDELKLIVSRKYKENWELNFVLIVVKFEVEVCECFGIWLLDKLFLKKLFFLGNGIVSVLLVGEGKEFSCLFCKGNYWVLGCIVVMNMEDRKVILMK